MKITNAIGIPELNTGRPNRGVPSTKYADFVQLTTKRGSSSGGISNKQSETLPIKFFNKKVEVLKKTTHLNGPLESGMTRPTRGGVTPAKFEDFVGSVRKRAASAPKVKSDHALVEACPRIPKQLQKASDTDGVSESGTCRASRGILPKKFRDFVESPSKRALLNRNSKKKSNPVSEEADAENFDKVLQKTTKTHVDPGTGSGRVNRDVPPKKFRVFVESPSKRAFLNGNSKKKSNPVSGEADAENFEKVLQKTTKTHVGPETGLGRVNRGVPPKKFRDFVESPSKGALLNGNSEKKSNRMESARKMFKGKEQRIQVPASRSPYEIKYRKGALLMRKRTMVRKIPAKMQASPPSIEGTSETFPEPDPQSDSETETKVEARDRPSDVEVRERQENHATEEERDAEAEPNGRPMGTKLTPVKFLEIVIPIAPNTKSRKIFLSDVGVSSDDSIWEKQPAIPAEETKDRARASKSKKTDIFGEKARTRKSSERLVTAHDEEIVPSVLPREKRKIASLEHSEEPHHKKLRGNQHKWTRSSSKPDVNQAVVPVDKITNQNREKSPIEILSPENGSAEGARPSRIRKPSMRLIDSAQHSSWGCELAKKKSDSGSSQKLEAKENPACRPKPEEKRQSPIERKSPENPSPGVRPSRMRRPSTRLMESAQYSTCGKRVEPAEKPDSSSNAIQNCRTEENSMPDTKQEERCKPAAVSEIASINSGPIGPEVRPSRIRRPSARQMESTQYSFSGGSGEPDKKRRRSSSSQKLETREDSACRLKPEERCKSSPVEMAAPKTESREVRPSRTRKPSTRLIESAQYSPSGSTKTSDTSSLAKQLGTEGNLLSHFEEEKICNPPVDIASLENEPVGISGPGRPSRIRKPSARLIESAQYSMSGRSQDPSKKRDISSNQRDKRGENSVSTSKQAEDQPNNVRTRKKAPATSNESSCHIESGEKSSSDEESSSHDDSSSSEESSSHDETGGLKPSLNDDDGQTVSPNEAKPITSKTATRNFRYVISEGKRFAKCSYCAYRTSNLSYIGTHVRVHSGERPFKCEECSYKATNKHTLQVHVRIHTGERPYPCGHCDYRAACRSSLITHVRRHTGVKPYGCGYCGHRSIQFTSMRNHMRNKHQYEEKFPFGGATVLNEVDIEDTEDAHTEETEPEEADTNELSAESHGCIMCDFTTSSFDGLASHMKIHL